MIVISSGEFRDKLRKYFDSVDNGEDVIIQRAKNKSYRIVPVTKDDTLMSKEEFYAKIDRSIQQAKEGKITSFDSNEDFEKFLGL